MNSRLNIPVRALAGVVALAASLPVCSAETVLVLESRDTAAYHQAANGFLEQWREHHPAKSAYQRTLTGRAEDSQFLTTMSEPPAGVVAVGPEATEWALRHTTGRVVFCLVANPQRRLLAGCSVKDTARVTGVSLDVPVGKQFQVLRDLLPAVARVGVIFDPKRSAGIIEEATGVAAELGLELVPWPVASEAGLPQATSGLAGRIDLLWAPVDPTVFNGKSAQFVLLKMLQQGIPVMGFSENMAKAGALLAWRLDYGDMGRQAAELLETSLQQTDGAAPAIESPRRLDVVVNAHVNRLLKKPIPSPTVMAVQYINED